MQDFELANSLVKKDLKEEISKKEAEINDLRDKLLFMNENKIEEITEEEYKIYKVFSSIDGQSSDVDKAKSIYNALKGVNYETV